MHALDPIFHIMPGAANPDAWLWGAAAGVLLTLALATVIRTPK